MSEWPKRSYFPDPLVHTSSFSMNSVGAIMTRGGAVASTAWPVANLAIFVPFRVTRITQLNTLFILNGTAVSGNADIGIYSIDGTKLISSGSTAQAGTSAIQTFSVASTELAPGLYYLAVAFDNTTSTIFAQPLGVAALLSFLGMAQMASALPLPASATFASIANAVIPFIGFTNRSFV